MRIQTILNSCQKFKSFVYQKEGLVHGEKGKHLRVTLVPHKNSLAICSCCGKPGGCYDHLEGREFEFVPLWGIPVYFCYRMRRVNCQLCGIKVERVPWCDGKQTMTKALILFEPLSSNVFERITMRHLT